MKRPTRPTCVWLPAAPSFTPINQTPSTTAKAQCRFEDVVHLNANFQVGPGPAYHVYLVPLDEVTPSTEVDKTMYVDLGSLRAFKGGQNYRIPAGTDLKDYKSVVIWCERFGVLISPAKLAFKGS